MSRQIGWKVPFADRLGNILTVNIHIDSDDPVTADVLKGSVVPFVTEHNNDTDIMAPSRVTTGYIRVVNEGNLGGIMPTHAFDRYVTLTNASGTMLWQGYIQPQEWGTDMYLLQEDVELPVVDILGVLDSEKMDDTRPFVMQAFGEYIAEAVAVMCGTVTTIEWPADIMAGFDYAAWMKIAVARGNWFKEMDVENMTDADSDKYERPTYKKLIENIAQLLGWTASIDQQTLRFTTGNMSAGYMSASISTIAEYSRGEVTLRSRGPMTVSNYALAVLQHVSTNNRKQTIMGVRSVKITAECNPIDDLSLGIDIKDIDYNRTTDSLEYAHVHRVIFESKQTRTYLHHWGFRRSDTDQTEVYKYEQGYNPARDDADPSSPYPLPQRGWCTAQLAKTDIYLSSEAVGKKNYNNVDSIAVDIMLPCYQDASGHYVRCKTGDYPIATFYAPALPKLTDGCFDLDITMKTDAYQGTTTPPSSYPLKMMLKVGNMFWSGSTWQSDPTTFEAELDGNHLASTKRITQPYEGATGYIIPAAGREGEVALTIYGSTLFSYTMFGAAPTGSSFSSSHFIFSALKLNYCNTETNAASGLKNTAVYSAASTTQGFREQRDMTLPMATRTGGMKTGNGILFYNDTPLDGNTFGNILEKRLLNKAKTQLLKTREQAEPIVQVQTPLTLGSTITWSGKGYTLLGQSYNWRDNEATLQIQK